MMVKEMQKKKKKRYMHKSLLGKNEIACVPCVLCCIMKCFIWRKDKTTCTRTSHVCAFVVLKLKNNVRHTS